MNIKQHITYKSHKITSKYISYYKSKQTIKKLTSISQTHPKKITIFYINKKNINIINLTNPFIHNYFISNITKKHYTTNFKKILIKNNIPKKYFINYI